MKCKTCGSQVSLLIESETTAYCLFCVKDQRDELVKAIYKSINVFRKNGWHPEVIEALQSGLHSAFGDELKKAEER